ncbi:DNA double-strand break repair nuclease NurA [Leptolyngbya sp. FACHB-261]|uniref:DNA double-strand break repair nuclease NurA n=1 Tax=Leptolyngbya sp. FACHB-261 TaxID=2692806 RepID=UPI001689538D|nr:DNA double-strand break repair nuclease NurA [Leptolyngbya sp. FACHB-261]MBD2105145.1 DNA double-strand break repair nuclease NurA [Leptolyngbya sp. FACHB-261]
MLDLLKLARQMQGMSQQLQKEAAATRQRLLQAQEILQAAGAEQPLWLERYQTWHDKLAFLAAEPVEALDTCLPIGATAATYTVVATDGSQIAPSHHEVAYCYLINIGRIVLHYGTATSPLLDSLPEVFYRPEDLYLSRQWGIRTEEWMGFRRAQSETVALADLACGLPSVGVNGLAPLQRLAMVDGSLIHWSLEMLQAEARERILPPMLAAWDRLRLSRIPVVGYLSASRSSEALNFLRLPLCPFPQPDCGTHCGAGNTETATDQAPCAKLQPLRDAVLWSALLEPGQRGPLYRSSARILSHYGPHRVYFCYVHVGVEVARVEMPEWVALDAELRESALAMVMEQVRKGYGYPVALAEAHNQAVVRGSDRARFFALLEQEMVRTGLQNVGTSFKEARKRGSIA